VLKDSDPSFIIDGTNVLSDGRELRLAAREAGLMDKYLCLEDVMADFKLNSQEGDTQQFINEYALGANGDIESIDSPALIIYTSGTTGNPKGVVSVYGTEFNLEHFQLSHLFASLEGSHT
jgi:long-subunit acyl-CoA synthetase (AMP-forming)